jgi:hypothetical protein
MRMRSDAGQSPPTFEHSLLGRCVGGGDVIALCEGRGTALGAGMEAVAELSNSLAQRLCARNQTGRLVGSSSAGR